MSVVSFATEDDSMNNIKFQKTGIYYDPTGRIGSVGIMTNSLSGSYKIPENNGVAELIIESFPQLNYFERQFELSEIMDEVYWTEEDGIDIYLDLSVGEPIITFSSNGIVYNFGGDIEEIENRLELQNMEHISEESIETGITPYYTGNPYLFGNSNSWYNFNIVYSEDDNSIHLLLQTKGSYSYRRVMNIYIEGTLPSPYIVMSVNPNINGSIGGLASGFNWFLELMGALAEEIVFISLPPINDESSTSWSQGSFCWDLQCTGGWNEYGGVSYDYDEADEYTNGKGFIGYVFLNTTRTTRPMPTGYVTLTYYETGLGSFDARMNFS